MKIGSTIYLIITLIVFSLSVWITEITATNEYFIAFFIAFLWPALLSLGLLFMVIPLIVGVLITLISFWQTIIVFIFLLFMYLYLSTKSSDYTKSNSYDKPDLQDLIIVPSFFLLLLCITLLLINLVIFDNSGFYPFPDIDSPEFCANIRYKFNWGVLAVLITPYLYVFASMKIKCFFKQRIKTEEQ